MTLLTSHITALSTARDEIARAMQEYEKRHKVETLPPRTGKPVIHKFQIHIPGKPRER